MIKKLALVAAIVAIPATAFAQTQVQQQPSGGATGGAVSGATSGAIGGAIVGGPVGAAVGGVGGAVVGAIIGDAASPRFRTYVVEQSVPSYRYAEPVTIGTVLPEEGITYREVPAEYGAPAGYRYTVVNERPVVVEPRTRRVVQIIN